MAYFDKINIARNDRAAWQKCVLQILKILYGLVKFDKNKWREKVDSLLKKQNIDECDKIMSFMGVKLQKEIFPKKIYDNLADYKFEELCMKGPAEYERVLTQLYGDYMKPPSIEKRVSHPMDIIID